MKKSLLIFSIFVLCNWSHENSKSQYCYGKIILETTVKNKLETIEDSLEDITIGTSNRSDSKGIIVFKKPEANQTEKQDLIEYAFDLKNILEINVHQDSNYKFKDEDYTIITIISKDSPKDPIECIISKNQKIIGFKAKGILASYPFSSVKKIVIKNCTIEKNEE